MIFSPRFISFTIFINLIYRKLNDKLSNNEGTKIPDDNHGFFLIILAGYEHGNVNKYKPFASTLIISIVLLEKCHFCRKKNGLIIVLSDSGRNQFLDSDV